MKICAIAAEYNPLHNGHAYLLKKAREETGADKIIVIMSGDFTQRGEAAVLNKYIRAIKAGADAVIELPAAFATAPAEIFAGGAVKLLASVPDVKALAFGCENDSKALIGDMAKILAEEPKTYKLRLKEKLKSGISFVRARSEAAAEEGAADISLITRPNNILAFEYTKAIKRLNADIEIFPIKRVGAEHNDGKIYEDISSSSAIRANMLSRDKKIIKALKSSMPEYVYEDLKNAKENNFKELAVYSLYMRSAKELKKIMGCTEGLENSFKAVIKDTRDYDAILDKLTSRRYTASRLRRIILASFLGITEDFINECLGEELYLKVLAVKKENAEETLAALSKAAIPTLTRKKDADGLKKIARECFLKDAFANSLYNFMEKSNENEYLTLFVE